MNNNDFMEIRVKVPIERIDSMMRLAGRMGMLPDQILEDFIQNLTGGSMTDEAELASSWYDRRYGEFDCDNDSFVSFLFAEYGNVDDYVELRDEYEHSSLEEINEVKCELFDAMNDPTAYLTVNDRDCTVVGIHDEKAFSSQEEYTNVLRDILEMKIRYRESLKQELYEIHNSFRKGHDHLDKENWNELRKYVTDREELLK